MAVCDLFLNEQAKVKALIELLIQKGLVTPAEIDEAMKSIGSIAPEKVAEDSQWLQQFLQHRMEARFQELLLHAGPTGPTQ